MLGSVWFSFQKLFSILENKKHKKLVWEESVFLFFVFSVFSKSIFLIIIKRRFHCFFIVQIIDCFSYFLFLLFVFS